MVKISAFQSLIPEIQFISKVPTKAYSTYSKSEINLEIKNNPYSFLNIIKENKNMNQEEQFNSIRKKINYFKKNKILKEQLEKRMYIYRQSDLKNSYTGLVCAVSLKDYENKKIKVHEKTIKNREILFAKYLKKTKIYAEPVLITYNGDLNTIIEKHISNNEKKTCNFKTKDEIKHEIWEIKENQEILEIVSFFNKIENLYIADGHHRMASSLRNNKNQKCLAYILGKNQLKTYPFHRKISNIKNPNSIFRKITSSFNVQIIKTPNNNSKNLKFYMNNHWYIIKLKNNKTQSLVEKLLVSKLGKEILDPIFKIKDERKDKNVSFIPGEKNMQTKLFTLNANEALFLMNKIDINTIIKIADQGKTTPPKSTFILPKIPSGLIMMELI